MLFTIVGGGGDSVIKISPNFTRLPQCLLFLLAQLWFSNCDTSPLGDPSILYPWKSNSIDILTFNQLCLKEV